MFFFPYEPPIVDDAAMDIWGPFQSSDAYEGEVYLDLWDQGASIEDIWNKQIEDAMHKLPPAAIVSCIETLLEMVIESRLDENKAFTILLEIFQSIRRQEFDHAQRLLAAMEQAGMEDDDSTASLLAEVAERLMVEEDFPLDGLWVWGEDNEIPSEMASRYGAQQMPFAPAIIRGFFGQSLGLPMWSFLNEWRNRCLRRLGFDRIEGAQIS